MSLIRNVLRPLAKSILTPSGLTIAASAKDEAVYKEMFASCNTRLLISNEEINDVMKIVEPLEKSGLLINSASEIIKNEANE